MTSTPGEKVDPAHWVSLFGGALMFVVLLLVSIALMSPWWTERKDIPGRKEDTEVSLWVRYTRMELAADASTLNCAVQCDFTKIGSAKVRESRAGWSDVCVEAATPELASNCQTIWVVRVGTMLCWFLALVYTALSTFNFCGAGLPASVRCAPAIKLFLGIGCVLSLVMALCVASIMEIKLEPTPPGTEPRDRPAPPTVGLNGLGFLCVVVSCILSVLGSGVAYLAQNVVNHLAELNDAEQGRPLADVNRGKAPKLDHQVQCVKDAPGPVIVGAWTDENHT